MAGNARRQVRAELLQRLEKTPALTSGELSEWVLRLLALRARMPSGGILVGLRRAGMAVDNKQLRPVLKELVKTGVLRLENSDHYSFGSRADLHQATLELLHSRPELIKEAAPEWMGWHALPHNGERLRIYLDQKVYYESIYHPHWAGHFWLPPWDPDFFFSRMPHNQGVLLTSLRRSFWAQGIWDQRLELVLAHLPQPLGRELSLELALARGQWEAAQKLLDTATRRKGYEAVLLFLRGQAAQAHERFQNLIRRRKAGQPALEAYVAVFARLAAARCNDLEALADPRLNSGLAQLDAFFAQLARFLAGTGSAPEVWEDIGDGLEWCVVWTLRDCLASVPSPRPECEARLRRSGLTAWAEQLVQPDWGHGVRPKEAWRTWLEALARKGRCGKAPGPEPGGTLEWQISAEGLEAYHQGKPVALASLIRKPPPYLSEWDHKVLGLIERQQWNQEVWIQDVGAAVRALIGHPRVLYQGQPVQLKETVQKLHLLRGSRGYRVELRPAIRGCFHLRPLGQGELEVCFPSPWREQLQPLLDTGQDVPFEAEDELRQALAPWLDKVELNYARGLRPLAEVVRGGELVARLAPQRGGLRLSWAWKTPGDGPAFPLLQGAQREALQWNGRLLQVERDFALERARLDEVLGRDERLPAEESLYPDLESALDLLRLLQSVGVAVEWPEGRAWRLRHRLERQAVQVQTRYNSESDWFEVQGSLRIDESLVLELSRTLQLLREFPGRYLRLGPDDYLELTDHLGQQLAGLGGLVEEHRRGLRLSPLAAPALRQLDLPLEADEAFHKSLERFAALDDAPARLPKTLQAELRDYQVTGFQWLAARAEAGLGACLADDMGLGKTVQALALMLLKRAGAHLVVCPTSVMANWRAQALAFAPGLRARFYEGKDRARLLGELEDGDLIIVSYRVLLQDQRLLSRVDWTVALLDEAQFIKNPETKTARAAYALKARVRLATTGTPIENRLTELWSIFRFLNPGLLGSLASFRKRYESNPGLFLSPHQRRLKRLLSPFLLRRTKAEVLTELPPRTEIVLQVELSAQERALYEELRRQAEDGLERLGQRFELLAHLTRLRQACCHPGLLLEQSGLTSAKFGAFFELVDDLLAGRHRFLVFSQFTRLLDLLEAELKQRGLEYLRLDGSTPVAERRWRVDAFQQGQGELFLISLKAGGTGLNLTAADYVVHLDPWWNPAAEDQASDRAHRLGQQRPVTIYRLIAQDTVEEKVMRLHGFKRKLAHDLLEGQTGESALSQEQLLELLKK